MPIDDATLRTAFHEITDKLTVDEAGAIIDVARLAASIDKKTDVGEMVVLLQIVRLACELAGTEEMPLPSTTIDENRILSIGDHLVPMGARELAFACAFLIMIQDLELTQEEGKLTSLLGDALVLEPARAKKLSAQMEAIARAARG